MNKLIGGSLMAFLLVLAGCVSTNPAVGAWDIEMQTPLGAMPAVLTIGEDGTGSMSGDLGVQQLSGIVVDGNNINFSTSIDAQGQSIGLTFSGSVDGDLLVGEFGSDFGSFAVNGSRQ